MNFFQDWKFYTTDWMWSSTRYGLSYTGHMWLLFQPIRTRFEPWTLGILGDL